MQLLPLACLCLLTCSAASADGNGPVIIAVEEGSEALLPCSLSTKENIKEKIFDWTRDGPNREVFYYVAGQHYNNGRTGQSSQFEGRVSHFEEELQHGNASILIRNTKVADSGDYACKFPSLQPTQIFHIKLVVGAVLKNRLPEDIPGAAPKPYVEILNSTEDWALLQCVVQGNPRPQMEWKDGAGNILPAEEPQVSERGDKFHITVNITVTKTSRYRCVATQEDIKHQVYTETYVYISDGNLKDRSSEHQNVLTALVVTAVVLLLLIAVVVGLVVKLYRKSKKGSSATRVPNEDSYQLRPGFNLNEH